MAMMVTLGETPEVARQALGEDSLVRAAPILDALSSGPRSRRAKTLALALTELAVEIERMRLQ